HLAGKYIMPGIINLHGHLGNTVDLTQDPKNFTRENVEKQLKLYASYGVTSVVSMGTDRDLIFQMRAEQRAGRPRMTRIFTAGRGFTGVGGYPTTAQGMKGVPFEVGATAEVDRDVAQLADQRVDVVKIWVDDHLGREKKIPLDLAKAIIADGHKHGLKVAAHVFYLDDAKALIDAGLDGLAHSVRDKPVDDELITAMKKHGAFQEAATLTREESTFIFAKPGPLLDDPFFTRGVSPTVLETLRSPAYQAKVAADPDYAKYPEFLHTAMQNLKKLSDSGVKIGFGTDSGPPARFPGYFEQWEMQLMTESGLTPMQAITDATHNAAEFLRAKDLGTLERGKWADLIVLGKNPLEDIRNTRSIEMVMIAGNKI
ncbi:MAG TPA: amidohydrolase family protein, partial [Bryobacteraceae bacterium]|nr:amidohydrolase family protein [Bryobacteraceae bacterium]